MLLEELVEMTMRIGGSIPTLDNYDLNHNAGLNYELIGKMQHGYEVFVTKYDNTSIYIVKNNSDDIMTMTQLKQMNIPSIGEVYEVMNSKTDPRFSGNLINYKLKYFLVHHLGFKILAGKVHSSVTENVLQKMPQYFDMSLINTKTGEMIDWSYADYIKTSSNHSATDWQTLLMSGHTPLKESMPNLPGYDNTRHHWTYNDSLFGDCL